MFKRSLQPGGSTSQTPLTPHHNDATAHYTAHHPASESAISGEAPDANLQRARHPKSDGGWSTRLKKIRDTKAVPHEPALRFEGDWKSKVAQEVCDHWVESQKAHHAYAISLVGLSRMKALDYERKHLADIPEDQRLLPGSLSKQDYYEAQINAFLNAIGISGDDLAALLESFKLAGTGGLHRQHVTVAATVSGLVGGTGQLLSSQHPAASATLYGVRLLLQGVTAERILDSGWRRLRNAGTEDVLPHGRADATPSAKTAPTMFEAAHAVIWELRGVEKNLSRMEAAKKALDDANAAYKTSGSAADKDGAEKAKQNLELVFARICYQTEVKMSYKASSESAKVEFRGNQRYLATSYAGTTFTLGAGLFSTLTPVLGSAAAPATGGVSIGVAALVMLLYAAYQLSSGPSKDGEAKAKRAIVALSKSIDVLSGDTVTSRKERAAAYETYIEDRKAARFKFGQARNEAKEAAKVKLLARLDDISKKDKVEDSMDAQRNWQAYRAYLEGVSVIERKSAQEQWPKERREIAIKQLEDQFHAEHRTDFSTKTIMDAWKNPMRIRMDTARRLLKGKVAQSHKRLIQLVRHPSLKTRISWGDNGDAINAARVELRKNLLNMLNLELALHRMKPLIDGNTSDQHAMERVAVAIAAIEDADVQSIFCGDGKEQVEAANKAKKLTAGEAERYVYTNAGASSLGIGVNVAVGATDFGLNVENATGDAREERDETNPEGKTKTPKYTDYKFATISQAGAPLAAHMNAGNRAAFQKTQMPKVLDMTTPPNEEHVELKVNFDSDLSHLEDAGVVEEQLDALVEQLADADSVPDKIVLSVARQVPDASGMTGTTPMDIAIDFQATAAYHQSQRKKAKAVEKWKVAGAKVGIVSRHALMSLAGLPAQGLAQYNLRKTRAALDGSAELVSQVRKTLAAGIPHGAELDANDVNIEDLQGLAKES